MDPLYFIPIAMLVIGFLFLMVIAAYLVVGCVKGKFEDSGGIIFVIFLLFIAIGGCIGTMYEFINSLIGG